MIKKPVSLKGVLPESMNAAQFKSAFLLSPLSHTDFRIPDTFKKAAVLIPLVVRHNQLNLLLTQRSKKLRHHPGQISFPGGRYEPEDHKLKTTALRETREETGIDPALIEIFGQMRNYPTLSRYKVTPFLGFVKPDYQLTIDHNEVEDVFEVPWQFFAKRMNHHQLGVNRNGGTHQVHFMPYKDRFIWGTTAHIIHDLVGHFE